MTSLFLFGPHLTESRGMPLIGIGLMIHPKLEENLEHARNALKRASVENIIDLGKRYLALLAEYRSQLFELNGKPDVRQPPASSSTPKELAIRKAIRAAIENATRERNRTEMLLLSITTISGYEAVEIFNTRKFTGHADWELRASGVKSTGTADLMTIQEAVDIAGMLQREEYVAQNAAQTL